MKNQRVKEGTAVSFRFMG